jgi:hypothetical protein
MDNLKMLISYDTGMASTMHPGSSHCVLAATARAVDPYAYLKFAVLFSISTIKKIDMGEGRDPK